MDDYRRIEYFYDKTVKLRGFIVVHSTQLGPALGGTRMFPYANEDLALDDALRLSKAMTMKAAAAELNLGGGKAVIIGDPEKNKTEALLLAFGREINKLGGEYITAEDIGINIDDLAVIRRATPFVTGYTAQGSSGDSAPATALGVFLGMRAAAEEVFGLSGLKGRTVAIQGLGRVGYALAKLLHRIGARLIVADINNEAVQKAQQEFNAQVMDTLRIHAAEADIFAPCAVGKAINAANINGIKAKIIAGCANNQLEDEVNDSSILHSKKILYIPDFLINAGGLINLADELRPGGYNRQRALMQVARIFGRVKALVKETSTNLDGTMSTMTAITQIVNRRLGITEPTSPSDYFG